MMGANWQKDDPQHSYEEKFAWWPVHSNSGKLIWLSKYTIRYTYYDQNGKPPMKSSYWKFVYTKNEFLLARVKGA
jgi:lipid-A-disaccharide synthase-like uncharacterized protein